MSSTGSESPKKRALSPIAMFASQKKSREDEQQEQERAPAPPVVTPKSLRKKKQQQQQKWSIQDNDTGTVEHVARPAIRVVSTTVDRTQNIDSDNEDEDDDVNNSVANFIPDETELVNEEKPKESPRSRAARRMLIYKLAYAIAVVLFVTNVYTLELWKQTEVQQDFKFLDMQLKLQLEFDRRLEDEKHALRKSFERRIRSLWKEDECVDEKPKCEAWMAAGECESNPVFMEWHCRKSCNACARIEDYVVAGMLQEEPLRIKQWQEQIMADYERRVEELMQQCVQQEDVLADEDEVTEQVIEQVVEQAEVNDEL